MSANASQITSVSIVCSIICSDADQRKYQSSASLAFVREMHRWPVESPHRDKAPVMFPFDGVITIGKHTAHNIVSRPNFKQWLMNHILDLIMAIRWGTYILTTFRGKWVSWWTNCPIYILHKMVVRVDLIRNTHNTVYIACILYNWWRHQMETFSALRALCARNSPVTGEFPGDAELWCFLWSAPKQTVG